MTFLRELFGLKPTMKGFVGRLLRAFPAGEAKAWVFDEGESMLRNPSGSEINLTNLFREYCTNKRAARADLIRKYVTLAHSSEAKIPALWVAAAKNVLPLVRSVFVETTVDIARRYKPAPRSPVASFPLAGDLQVRLAYDHGNFMAFVTGEQLAEWGQKPDDVRARAIANLARLESPTWIDSGMGFHQLASPMSFAESMLQLDRVIDRLPYAASAVVLPCNRGVLLAVDGRSQAALAAMIERAIVCAAEEPWPMTSTLCTRVDGIWHAFQPTGDAARLAHNLFVIDRGAYYRDQKDALDKFHEAHGRDVFVASFLIVDRQGAYRSFCSWTQSVQSLLPVTDMVGLSALEQPDAVRFIAWDQLVAVCGHRMQVTEESPARFLVESFPDAEEWGRLVDVKL